MSTIKPVAAAQTSNYDYLRRKNSERAPVSRESSLRKPIRDPSERVSNGTVSSAMTTSTGYESAMTNITEPPAFSKKIVVVGDGGCGKTCLLISYAEGHFPEKYVPTVFENYITMTTHPPTGKSVELALWDTAGQEEYDRLRPLSYPETDLIFVCFAIDCPNSLENVMDKWYPEVLHFCPTTPIILCGLKSDLRNKKSCIDLLRAQGLQPISTEQGRNVARKMGAHYMECSSKERIGIEEIFDTAITMAVGDEGQEREVPSTSGSGSAGAGGRSSGLGVSGKRKKKRGGCRIL
ncbi:ras-domain-containing protein [Trichodelitschia bisporula]|uniref:Ras-domain-containing protein n=1 Tax=Trichodelitschia bisporula TaxID=703511 RepID=A0A6G1HKL6_9PEZI|nr:ras-domain-containing protein [Trichodelitschia bisporula]